MPEEFFPNITKVHPLSPEVHDGAQFHGLTQAFGMEVVNANDLYQYHPDERLQAKLAKAIMQSKSELSDILTSYQSDRLLSAIISSRSPQLAEQRRNTILNFIDGGLMVVSPKGKQTLDRLKRDVSMPKMDSGIRKNLNSLSDQDWIGIVRQHVEGFYAEHRELERNLPVTRQEFLGNLTKWANEKGIDLPTGVLTKIDHTEIELADPLRNDFKDLHGAFLSSGGKVYLSREALRLNRDKTIYHEFLHAVSGRTVIKESVFIGKEEVEDIDDEEFDGNLESFDVQRVGLRTKGRFGWLNEAVTEEIVGELTGKKDVYYKERKLLELLKKCGKNRISDQQIYNAYFEDYDPSLPRGERIPYWKEFYHAVNEAYEPGFLVLLDKIVNGDKRIGVQKAIQYMEDRFGG